jgi:hypothetical protein
MAAEMESLLGNPVVVVVEVQEHLEVMVTSATEAQVAPEDLTIGQDQLNGLLVVVARAQANSVTKV